MAETPKRAGPTLITTSTATIYTASSTPSTWSILRSYCVANETVNPITVTIGIGTSNTDAAGKRVVRSAQVQPGESLVSPGGMFIPLAGGASPDLVYALSDTTNGATITLGVVEGP